MDKIIRKGTTLTDMSDDSHTELVKVHSVWVDEDGVTQVNIQEYDNTTVTLPSDMIEQRTVTKDDLLDRLNNGELYHR